MVQDTSLDQLAPQQVTDRGQPLLAFMASDKLSSLAKRSALQQSDGWIVHGEEVRPWRFSGYLRRGETLLVTGPWVAGELLIAALQGPRTLRLPPSRGSPPPWRTWRMPGLSTSRCNSTASCCWPPAGCWCCRRR